MMEKASENKMGASEIVNHLRKMHKEYKMYEHALEIANSLAQSDKMLSESKKEIADLEGYKASLNKELDEAESRLDAALAKSKEATESADVLGKKAKADYDEIIRKAKDDAANIEQTARSRTEILGKQIAELSAERERLEKEREAAEKALEKVTKSINDAKQRFIEKLQG